MTAITIQEFSVIPGSEFEPTWPPSGADVVTAVTSPTTVNTAASTRFIVVTSEADCRMIIGSGNTVSSSSLPIMGAILNNFRLDGSGATALKFL